MRMKKCLSILLAVVMIATMITSLPITANAVEIEAAGVGEGTVIEVGSAKALADACTTINTNGGTYTISLTADIEEGHIEIKNKNAVVTVIGNGHTLTATKQSAVYVANGATVNLGNGKTELTLSGKSVFIEHKEPANDEPGLIYILPGSTCNMDEKVTLKDRTGNNYYGGGVTVQGGTFIMNGGTIENCGINGGSVCYGGGVAVFNGGSFTMNDGTITDCYVTSDYLDNEQPSICFTALGGGVFVTAGSTFTMNGGTISKCRATNFGGGIAVVISHSEINGYYAYLKSKATINNGTIAYNTATGGAGVYVSGYSYAYSKSFSWNSGTVGSPTDPGLYISNSTIKNNTANGTYSYSSYLIPNGLGGGILAEGVRTPVKIENSEILSNSADKGAGLAAFYYWVNPEINHCTISGNIAKSGGGGNALILNNAGTALKNTTITDNTSHDLGGGVFYDNYSKLMISGANIIQNNKLYDVEEDKYYDNNLNVLDVNYPVYINGDLTDSKIGLSDPDLWYDDYTDDDERAVSTSYLTSGYSTNNSGVNPSKYFTSDHDTWFADYSDVNTNEVRLVRKTTVDYHINNDVIDDKYGNSDIFTDEITKAGTTVEVDKTIDKFYTVPEVVSTPQNTCPYIFKGWYYDKDNENDARPVKFDEDKYTAGRDIYAHWIKVDNVDKDSTDEYILPNGNTYGGFDLAGVQIREGVIDTNYDNKQMPGGMRFITSLSKKVVSEINKLKSGGNNIEYGYVTATANKVGWIDYHDHYKRKLQYVSASANGINTLNPKDNENETYFGFAKNVNCTSRESNSSSEEFVKEDHRSYDGYLLYTLVVTYEGATDAEKELKVLARPYIHYTDANGLERVAYSDYNGNRNKLGGCYISYKDVK